MQFDPEKLREHYASLSDEALLDLDRKELVEVAQTLYDQELASRGLEGTEDAEEPDEPDELDEPVIAPRNRQDFERKDSEAKPPWLEEATVATSFRKFRGLDSVGPAEDARDALENAGIPCCLELYTEAVPAAPAQQQEEYRLMVPGHLILQAVSVLDKEVFNPQNDDRLSTYFETLSDDELRELDTEILVAGWLDRIDRLKKAYRKELAQRGLKPSPKL